MEIEKLDLGTKCTIIRAEELHAQMEALLQSEHDVEIDSSKVEQLDTSGLQLLLSFHSALQQADRQISWLTPSPQTISSAKLLGLDQLLGLHHH
jgi:anti-anti-sigma regulatory factor